MNICKVEGCTLPNHTRGLCQYHQYRFQRYGDPLYDTTKLVRICKVEGCNNKHKTRGFCGKHYVRWVKHKDPLYTPPKKNKACSVKRCSEKVHCKGFCKKHYDKWLRHGDPLIGETREKHGMSHSFEYMIWASMKYRCSNINDSHYHRYGGRGITVCDKWESSFLAFYKDMGDKPFSEAQIDRIDNDGNYEPNNCHWATPKENVNNRSISKKNRKPL